VAGSFGADVLGVEAERVKDEAGPARHYLVDSDDGSPARPRARYHGDPHPARHLWESDGYSDGIRSPRR